MRYKYTRYLNDLNDLKHIEWFVCHSDEYEFHSQKSQETLGRLKKNITKKNIFYSVIIKDYEALVKRFDNDPYNYAFDISGDKKGIDVKSSHYRNYFIKIKDKEGKWYNVPYGYILDHPAGHNKSEAREMFEESMTKCKKNALENLYAIVRHYSDYFNIGGVAAALERYEKVRCGKDYHIVRQSILFLIYNVLLLIILAESQFFNVVTHFWKIWSEKASDIYSAMSVFSGHKYLGTIAILCIIYFIVMDVYYAYGIFYIVYMKRKYDAISRYHSGVQELFFKLKQDYELCKKGITGNIITKIGHRESVYIPLITKTNRRYKFIVERTVNTQQDKTVSKVKKRVIESILVPHKLYYSHSLSSRVIWILILLIFVQSICNYSYMIIY